MNLIRNVFEERVRQRGIDRISKVESPLRIFLAGLPGAGKTTVIEILQNRYHQIEVESIERKESPRDSVFVAKIRIGKSKIASPIEIHWASGEVEDHFQLWNRTFRWCHGLIHLVDLTPSLASTNLKYWFNLGKFFASEPLLEGHLKDFPCVLIYNKIDNCRHRWDFRHLNRKKQNELTLRKRRGAKNKILGQSLNYCQRKQVAFYDQYLNFYFFPRYLTWAPEGINIDEALFKIIVRAASYQSEISKR